MALVLTAAPAVEPVTVAEAKAHLRIDHTGEDALVSSLVVTSRLHIEAALGLALITQGWSWRLDAWPELAAVPLPMRPVQSVDSVAVTEWDGSLTVLDSSRYLVDGAGIPPRLVSTEGPWPRPGKTAQGIEITFTAGYGSAPAAVPEPLRQALLMLVAHWHEHREPVLVGEAASRVPDTISALLGPYRRVRL